MQPIFVHQILPQFSQKFIALTEFCFHIFPLFSSLPRVRFIISCPEANVKLLQKLSLFHTFSYETVDCLGEPIVNLCKV